MSINLNFIAEILCNASQEEIDAINQLMANQCGQIIMIVPPGTVIPTPLDDESMQANDAPIGDLSSDDSGNDGDGSQPPSGPGNPPH